MTEPVKEQLSACLDGELPEGELDLLLKQLQRDPQLRQSMGSYALIGEALRAQRPVTATSGFAARISATIAAEPPLSETETAPSRARRRPFASIQWLKPAAGIAIAAGVAAIAVLSLQPQDSQPSQLAQTGPGEVSTPVVAASSSENPSYTVPPTNMDSVAFIPAARLTNYVVAHSEYSAPLGRRTAVLSGVLAEDEEEEGSTTEPTLDPTLEEPATAPRQ